MSSGVLVRAATSADAPHIWTLVREFAVHLKLEAALTGSAERLAHYLALEPPAVEGLVAELDGKLAGYALFFPMYSSLRTSQVLFIEDLFVSESARRRGVAKALMARLASITLERGWPRMEWHTVASDGPANALYRGLGSQVAGDTVVYRMGGKELMATAALDRRPRGVTSPGPTQP